LSSNTGRRPLNDDDNDDGDGKETIISFLPVKLKPTDTPALDQLPKMDYHKQ